MGYFKLCLKQNSGLLTRYEKILISFIPPLLIFENTTDSSETRVTSTMETKNTLIIYLFSYFRIIRFFEN
jgi:hypothetical protein